MKRYELMVPGPVPVEPEVLAALAQPLVAHYGDEWTHFYLETVELLKQVIQTKGHVFLLVGSGSAGLDALTGSLLGRHGKAVVLSNGAFGERLYDITRSHTDCAAVIRIPAGQRFESALLKDALKRRPVDVVLVTHCETSTGILNPVKELNAVCREYGCLLAVDAVSSLGGAPLPMDDWGIEACVTATQKCLGAPPGLAVVAVRPRAWRLIEQSDVRGWYLNLRTWKEYSERWADWHPYPVTLPTGLVEALRKSLELILREGLETRLQRHADVAAFLRRGLRNLGLKVLAPEEFASPTVTVALTGGCLRDDELLRFLKAECNIVIAEGSGELRGKTFRIGHMGPSATRERILKVLNGIEKVVQGQGVELHHGLGSEGLLAN
jgi:alanine-glyoxylate transaminase / serine-glyoxylate transaminase / serine-pyruvate transaminase